MTSPRLLFVVLVLTSACYAQSMHGKWTDSRYGGDLFLCVDDNSYVWGTYSEAGVYWGYVDESNIAKGRWYQAGNSACNSGYWESFLSTSDGNSLSFIASCDFGFETFNYTETRQNGFANSDDCHVVSNQNSIPTIEGTWGNIQSDIAYLDFCVSDDDDDDESQASYSATGVNATIGFMYGQTMEEDHLFQGDYSSLNMEGRYKSGQVLFFPVDHKSAVMFTWPGAKIRPFGNHQVITNIQYRDGEGERCQENRFIVTAPSSFEFSSASTIMKPSTIFSFLSVIAGFVAFM